MSIGRTTTCLFTHVNENERSNDNGCAADNDVSLTKNGTSHTDRLFAQMDNQVWLRRAKN